MTLAIERHHGALWLVLYATPSAPTCTLLAEFRSQEAADAYVAASARTMCFSREVGRSGLG